MADARAFILAAAVAFACAAAGRAGAQPPGPEPPAGAVALLPLDAPGKLEIYGQAVATEIARALTAGGVPVVVVGASMDVPAGARLVVDGTLAMDRGTVALAMRVRTPIDGKVLDTLSASAPGLAQIDRAAADLSARVVPVVRVRLAELAERPGGERPGGGGPVHQRRPSGAAPRSLLVAVASSAGADPLLAALTGAVQRWVRAARREPRTIDPSALGGVLAPRAVAAANAERAIAFEVLRYAVTRERDVPLARARVRVRISDASAVVFDRVVATDTIVGERAMADAALAARVADEVLAILRPHVRRVASPWP